MNHASLFSGIGGFDLAAREVGWNNVFQCEIDPFCQSVLKYYFPKTVLYEDIKRTDFTSWKGKIDVLTGGFPCQPFSVAGQRKGADDNRYLWPEMLRVIRETRPLWVIGENVAGITNMVQPGSETDVETKSDQDEENYKETILEQEYIINTICDDIEREGYSVQPIIIPACGVGAPHRRDRVWFIAHSNGSRGLQFGERRDIRDKEQYDQDKEPERHEQPSRFGGSGEAYVISDSDNERLSTIGITDRVSSAERWKDFPTQPPVCRGNDGLPFNVDNLTIPYGKWRKESIKAYGNAIVPLIAVKIFEMINKIEGYEQQTTL
jgi:DNA (cytosine-5)-methyltransferase 1